MPKRLRGMLADRPRAVAALTKIFLDEIEQHLLAASGGAPDAETPRASRPRLGGVSFLHRFGSALNHHVRLHACVTDGIFVPAADQAGGDAPPTFLPARPGANGVVELSPFELLDRLVDLVPPPRKHRHRYHGVFAPNHKLRRAVTALALGNIGKQRDAATGGHATGGQPTESCCDTHAKPRSHDTSRIAWAKLMARVGEEFRSSAQRV